MRNNNILKIILVDFLAVLIAILVGAILFWGSSIKLQAENTDALLLQNGGNYDYLVRNPSIEQIASYKSDPNVSRVSERYEIEFRFTINEKIVYVSVICSDDIEMTEFFEDRLIDSVEADMPIYIDYSFAQQHGIKIGDKLKSETQEFTVVAIYKTLDADVAYSP